MVRTFLKVYMELVSYFLFLQEQIKDIIIIRASAYMIGDAMEVVHLDVSLIWYMHLVSILRLGSSASVPIACGLTPFRLAGCQRIGKEGSDRRRSHSCAKVRGVIHPVPPPVRLRVV